MKKLILICCLLLTAFAIYAQENGGQDTNSKIVDVEWLASNITDPNLVIVHVASLKLEYDREHIPGARYLFPGWLTISTPDEATTFAPVKDIKKVLESLGISNNSKIVLTFIGVQIISACRVYLTLDYFGLGENTYMLNGGVEAWKSAGNFVVKEVPAEKRGKLTQALKGNVVYPTEWIVKNLKSSGVKIIDTRSAPFYMGTSGGPRYGHIPGAVNIPIAKLYDENFRFHPDDKIREVFQNADVRPENELITYCFVGNAASVAYFVARHLGYHVHLYDGSMDEWGNRFELPLEKVEVGK
jgi:thiosulfate/3-mercaptopyruvate sulfurtransferase